MTIEQIAIRPGDAEYDAARTTIAGTAEPAVVLRPHDAAEVARGVVARPQRLQVGKARLFAEIAFGKHAMNVFRDFARFGAGDDDGRPRREVCRERPAQPFDDRAGIASRQQSQLANQHYLLTSKRTIG